MFKLITCLFLLVLLIPTATAATVTISPAAIDPGDTVTVNVQGIPDGAAFSLGIRGEFDANSDDRFSFTARNLVLPFSLGSGEVSAYTRGTAWTGLSVQMPDGASASLSSNADANGEFRTTQSYNICRGTYEAITLDGKAAAGSIVTELTMMGTKKGPADGTISFSVDGITDGTATVTVYIDGAEALSRVITIGSPSSPGADDTPSSGSTGSSGSPSGSPSTDPVATEPGSVTETSADGKASLAGADLSGAGLLALAAQGTAPAGWSLSGKAYAVTPEGQEFDPAVVLSFRLPSADARGTLARYENGVWTLTPSKIEGDRITTMVSRAGTYTLLVAASAAETTTMPTTTVTAATTTAATTAPVATTPAAAPITPLLPILALATVILGWRRRT